jgi:N-acetyl-gamma-glutamyl-phosphate reductase
MINAAICGITGYTGLELIRVLLRHPRVAIKALTARFDKQTSISDVYPEFKGRLDITCESLVPDKLLKKGVDVVFLALPHRVSMEYAPSFIKKGKAVVDLSADFRIKNVGVYEKYYNIKHISKEYIKSSIYGLPELNKNKIKNARLIANPGCYPTGSILAVAPLASKSRLGKGPVILDAKSGATGAGRKADKGIIFSEVSENMKAYKVGIHQHTPEIEQELGNAAGCSVNIIFTPQLVPIRRGILTTAYIPLKKQADTAEISALYRSFYKDAPFIKVYEKGLMPQIKDVAYTNNCAIGVAISRDKKTAIIVTVIDNLLKGASGQAVQNMNIMFGLPETMGLV